MSIRLSTGYALGSEYTARFSPDPMTRFTVGTGNDSDPSNCPALATPPVWRPRFKNATCSAYRGRSIAQQEAKTACLTHSTFAFSCSGV